MSAANNSRGYRRPVVQPRLAVRGLRTTGFASALVVAAFVGACSPPDGPTLTDEAAPVPTPAQTPAATAVAPTPSTEPSPSPVPIADRPLPTTYAALVDALDSAETAIRDPAVDDAEAAQWGQFQQRLYSVLAEAPEWHDAVTADVDPSVAFAVERNLAARLALTSLVQSGPLADTVPAWRLREPLPVAELLGYYREGEALTGVPWSYLAAINLVETRMGRIEGLSTAGATGPMQFLPSTWDECCQGDPTVDRDAIVGAATYLAQSGGPDDMRSALFRYNNSDRYVDGIRAYADVLADDELAYRGYHGWQVYFLSAAGLLRLTPGYYEPEPVPVTEWVAANPDALVAPPDD